MRMLMIVLLGIGLSETALSFWPRPTVEQGLAAMRQGNFAEAYCQWKPLAYGGNPHAQYHLGWLYANGNGMNVDPDLAVQWWTEAAKQGHADAQFAIGMALLTERGGKDRREKALEWFVRAAQSGQPDARDMLASVDFGASGELLKRYPDLLDQTWFGWKGHVRSDSINVREKPTTDSAIVTKLDKSAEVRVVGEQGDWLQVVLPVPDAAPQLAWIYRSLVQRIESGPE